MRDAQSQKVPIWDFHKMPMKGRVWSELFSPQPAAKWVDGPRRHSYVEPTDRGSCGPYSDNPRMERSLLPPTQ